MKSLRRGLLIFGLLVCSQAFADFAATEAEYRAWPDYCQAKYGLTNIGGQMGFSGRATPVQIKKAKLLLGRFFVHVHHYCWAIAEEKRYLHTTKESTRNHWLGMATGDAGYSLQRIDSSNVLYPMVVAVNARLEFYAGNATKALNILDDGIKMRAKSQILYYFKAFILRKLGKKHRAQRTLQVGAAVIHNPGSEYHYLYGIVCLETDDLNCARKHAEKAYKMGYPLPGLKLLLRKKGIVLK